jgi:hypothetical protein
MHPGYKKTEKALELGARSPFNNRVGKRRTRSVYRGHRAGTPLERLPEEQAKKTERSSET